MKTNMEKKFAKSVFCANEQSVTSHVLSADNNGEILLTCEVCGRTLKLPAGISKEKFEEFITSHQTANEGQVSQESIEKTLSDLVGDEEKPE